MQKTINRKRVWNRTPKFAPETRHKVLAMDEVVVVNPVTKQEESHIVNTYKEEPEIDPRLRASDFSLEVQIKQGVELKDCGKYFTPSDPEEYAQQIAVLCSRSESAYRKLVPEPTSEPTSVPTSVPTPEDNPEPVK